MLFFIGVDLGVGDPGMVVDGNVGVFPAGCGSIVALIALAGAATRDAMPYAIETAKFFDVDMNDLANLRRLRCGCNGLLSGSRV